MPDPKKYDSEEKWMAACVPTMLDEGKKQEQAVAACLNMWRNKERGEGQGTGGERQEDGGTDICVCPECGAEVIHKRGTPCVERECPKCGATMVGKEMDDKEIRSFFEAVRDFFTKEKPMKTVGGVKYPSSDFLVVEDPQSPDTWHLQVKKHGKPDHGLMGGAKAALTAPGGHRGNKYQGPNKSEALAKLKRLYNSEGIEWKELPSAPFMVWKETNGRHRWLAVYSNKWRDEDKPPEILAETAHKGFVDAVDAGEWPLPELWLWHVAGTKSGAADFVAYDDTGFALASGTFDQDKEVVAERLAEMDLLTSHGMPAAEIERDEGDPTIITRYRSKEISPLPQWAAANKHGTGFTILKEVEMALPEKKRGFLEDVMGKEAVADLEEQLEGAAKELEDQDIEFKEETEEQAPEEEPKEAEEEVVTEPEPNYVTYEDLEQVFAGYVKPLNDAVHGLREVVEALGKEIKEQQEQVKSLQEDDEAKLKQMLADTPAASLFDRIGSVIGTPEAVEDGRSSLAKSKPKEAMDGANGPTFVPWLNEMISGQVGG
jgi:hypothetical protein